MAREQLSLPERVGIAAELAIRAGAYHGLWHSLASAESRERHIKGLVEHWDALRLFQAGQLYALVLTLTSLFETRADTVNFASLSNSLDDAASAEIAACQPLVKKVLKLRHHLFAHRSATLDVKGVYQLAQLTSDNLKELVERAFQIATLFCAKLGLDPPVAPTAAIAAADGVLAALKREVARSP